MEATIYLLMILSLSGFFLLVIWKFRDIQIMVESYLKDLRTAEIYIRALEHRILKLEQSLFELYREVRARGTEVRLAEVKELKPGNFDPPK